MPNISLSVRGTCNLFVQPISVVQSTLHPVRATLLAAVQQVASGVCCSLTAVHRRALARQARAERR